jgi:enoyl-CoA hydratase/carnithine racemase
MAYSHNLQALNALNGALIVELVDALENFDKDPGCSAIVLTGMAAEFATFHP